MGIDISCEAVAVGEFGRIPSFPQVFINLADTAGAGFTALTFAGAEGGAGFLGAVSISWLISDLAIPRSIFAAAVLRISSVT